LKKYNIPAELVIYEAGGHGFGLNNKTSTMKWTDALKSWMVHQNIIGKQ
jgi:hypothetical protein